MLVYGDHAERIDPHARLAAIAAQVRKQLDHDALTGAFLDVAGVAQGIADADFAVTGVDRARHGEEVLLRNLTDLARALLGSWDCGGAGALMPAIALPPGLPPSIKVKLPEGFAFYALRPEAFALAARQLVLVAPPRIIGLRSIGTGLACMAAAALGAPPPVTMRPTGDPFARELRLSDEFAAALLDGDAHYVIVDEGPGLSGSSFGAVADWLEDCGVSADRIAFLPGHGNSLGQQASERHRRRWERAQRPVVALDEPRRERIETLTGPITGWRDLSAGAWRSLRSAGEAAWPAIDPTWERRKFLAHTSTGEWLAKFAGLGRIGEERLALAREVHASGFGPEVAGLAEGWLITRWHIDAQPTRPTMDELLAYLRFRAALPAPQPGASPETLLAMVHRNLRERSGWSPDIADLEFRPVCTDNRMAAHEWLRLPSGRLIKADAVDHHQAHDLIGCQDIAWDVAGAVIELDLSAAQAEELRAALDIDLRLLRFMQLAYAAFRVGAHRLSAASLGHWPDEQRRNLAAAERTERRLTAVDAVEHACDVDQPL
jgi:hypothetical protein